MSCGTLQVERNGHHGPPPVGAVVASMLAVLGRHVSGNYTQGSLEFGARRIEEALDAPDFRAAF